MWMTIEIYTILPPNGWVLWQRSNRVAISMYIYIYIYVDDYRDIYSPTLNGWVLWLMASHGWMVRNFGLAFESTRFLSRLREANMSSHTDEFW